MTLFANLFAGSSAPEETVLFTDRNPFFADATARPQDLKVEKKAKKVGTEPVVTKSASNTRETAKRRRRELGDGPQAQVESNCHDEDGGKVIREKGGKQRKVRKDQGAKPEAVQEEVQPRLKKVQKAVQQAQMAASDSLNVVCDETDERDAEKAGSPELEDASQPAAAAPSAETLKRTIFVGNLPQGTTSKDLKKLFKRFGSIESVRIRSLAATADVKMSKALQVKAGKTDCSKGSINGYVLFITAEHADAAHALNMTLFNGQHIRVDRAAPPKEGDNAGSVRYDSRKSVFVGNLPRDVKEEDLISVFNSGEEHPALEGAVEAVRVVRDQHCRVGKGIAYVLFRTKVAALAALRMHGSECGGREMRVMRVEASCKKGTGGKGAQRLQNKKMLPGGVHKKKKDGAPKKDKSHSTPQPAAKKQKRTQKRPAVAARKLKAT